MDKCMVIVKTRDWRSPATKLCNKILLQSFHGREVIVFEYAWLILNYNSRLNYDISSSEGYPGSTSFSSYMIHHLYLTNPLIRLVHIILLHETMTLFLLCLFRTNIYVNPPVAPPLVGGYGYGVPFYGGWGWSPFSFFAPGPGVAVGVGGGFDTLVLFLVLGAVASVLRRVLRSRDEDEY